MKKKSAWQTVLCLTVQSSALQKGAYATPRVGFTLALLLLFFYIHRVKCSIAVRLFLSFALTAKTVFLFCHLSFIHRRRETKRRYEDTFKEVPEICIR